MADQKITELDAFVTLATSDLLVGVDISDTAMAASGTNKKITVGNLFRSVPAGTEAAPGLAVNGDTDTGIFSDTADTLSISAGGAEGLRLKESAGEAWLDMDALPIEHTTEPRTIAIGRGIEILKNGNGRAVILGDGAFCDARFGWGGQVAIGCDASVRGEGAIAIGDGATVTGSRGIAVGDGAQCASGIVFGSGSTSNGGFFSVSGELAAKAQHDQSAVIASGVETDRDFQFLFGSRFSANVTPNIRLVGSTNQYTWRDHFLLETAWADGTDATRKSRSTFQVSDFNGWKEVFRIESSGTAPMIGFLGASAAVRQDHIADVPTAGSATAADNATAINAILAALEAYGLLETS